MASCNGVENAWWIPQHRQHFFSCNMYSLAVPRIAKRTWTWLGAHMSKHSTKLSDIGITDERRITHDSLQPDLKLCMPALRNSVQLEHRLKPVGVSLHDRRPRGLADMLPSRDVRDLGSVISIGNSLVNHQTCAMAFSQWRSRQNHTGFAQTCLGDCARPDLLSVFTN
jgi:hypothetical protein